MRFSTRAIHAGWKPDPTTGAVMPPVYQNSTYAQEWPGRLKGGHDYSRTRNPTRTALEENIAALEGGRHGLAFSSGMAAINTVMNLLSAGDHVVAGNDLYGGTYRLFTKVYRQYGLHFDFVDTTSPENVRRAMRDDTRLVYVETPSNPLLSITDIVAVAEAAHAGGALLAVDNTFATPFLQQPLRLGADIVVHSTTKYMGGHSDVVGGALVTDDAETFDRLKFCQNSVGAVPGPWDCFLVLRGTKTLAVRMRAHCENAGRIVDYLHAASWVRRVYYPGLAEHPNHEVAARQMSGFGGMISFVMDADVPASERFLSRLNIFSLAESLGGVESLCEHPASMTHASIPREERLKIGLEDGLVRLSVGIEDVDDLIADLEQAREDVVS